MLPTLRSLALALLAARRLDHQAAGDGIEQTAGIARGRRHFGEQAPGDGLEAVLELLRRGETTQDLFDATKIDPWFLSQLKEIIDAETEITQLGPIEEWKYEIWREVKRLGFSDARIGEIVGCGVHDVEDEHLHLGQIKMGLI